MRVTLLVSISGTRNGLDWPPAGSVVDLPADEAEGMIACGHAVAPKDAPKVEAATVDTSAVEKAVGPKAAGRKPA